MRQFRKTATRPNYLFGQLPWYFKDNDTYVPNVTPGYETNGLLERYLEIFCAETDLEIVPYINGLGLLPDAEALTGLPQSDPTKFLDHIAEIFGNPPNIGTEAQYITLLRHIIWILQTKGSRQSIELFLNIFGYKIFSLTSDIEISRKYDSGLKFDNGVKYDYGMAFYSNWLLNITPVPGSGKTYPGVAWLELLREAIQKFLAPISAVLSPIQYSGAMGDTMRGTTNGVATVSGRAYAKGKPAGVSNGVATVSGTLRSVSIVFPANATTYWVVGSLSTDMGIVVNYVGRRGTGYGVGEIRFVRNDSTPAILHEWDADDLGFTVDGNISGNDLRLAMNVDNSSGDSLYIYYTIDIIKT